jgi:hypothetical protein
MSADRSQAASLVWKGIRQLATGHGSLQERVADALPEAGWLASDDLAVNALSDQEKELLTGIRSVDSRDAALRLSDAEATQIAQDWLSLLDSLVS